MFGVKKEDSRRFINIAFILVFVGLLILRFPLLIVPKFIPVNITSDRISLLFENGTYLLTAILILLVKDRLSQYKFNVFAIAIFILAPIIKPIVYLSVQKNISLDNVQYSRFQIIVSIILCLFLVISHAKLHNNNLGYYIKWILLAIVVGTLTGVGIGLLYSYFQERSQIHVSFYYLIFCFITQLTNAAILEEPLFRGFLWGILEARGWKQVWIWLLQAGLFCIGHTYYLPQYPVFFIGTFVTGLIFGFLVWKSKSVGTSMIAHGLTNSVADLVMHFVW